MKIVLSRYYWYFHSFWTFFYTIFLNFLLITKDVLRVILWLSIHFFIHSRKINKKSWLCIILLYCGDVLHIYTIVLFAPFTYFINFIKHRILYQFYWWWISSLILISSRTRKYFCWILTIYLNIFLWFEFCGLIL